MSVFRSCYVTECLPKIADGIGYFVPCKQVVTSRLEQLFIHANYFPASLAAKLDFASPSVEALNADR